MIANIYLDRFDQEMKARNIRIVRYADYILIFARTKQEAGGGISKLPQPSWKVN